MVSTEAIAVEPLTRITPNPLGCSGVAIATIVSANIPVLTRPFPRTVTEPNAIDFWAVRSLVQPAQLRTDS